MMDIHIVSWTPIYGGDEKVVKRARNDENPLKNRRFARNAGFA
jgi:hypothetical protein